MEDSTLTVLNHWRKKLKVWEDEKIPMLMNCHKRYRECVWITKSNLQSQGSSQKNSNDIHHRIKTTILKLIEGPGQWSNSEQREQGWRCLDTTRFCVVLENGSIKGSMGLAQKWTHRSTEWRRCPEVNLTAAVTRFWQRWRKYTLEQGDFSSNPAGRSWYSPRRMNLDPYLSPFIKTNSKWFKGLKLWSH